MEDQYEIYIEKIGWGWLYEIIYLIHNIRYKDHVLYMKQYEVDQNSKCTAQIY